MIKHIALLLCLIFFFLYSPAQQKNQSASDILLSLQKLNTLGSVLYIAAHPDDENTRLLSYYSNEKKFRTAYLALTRGDGGQNLIGSEQGDLLGVIRTQELLGARRIDGAEQYFSRAIDFGYSKNPEETFSIWNKDSILSDVVWAIRKFQPDVIILRFPTTGEGGHGHHTASAILGLEAFTAASDPKVFPEQLKYFPVWQAKRIFWNMFRPKEDEIKGKPDIVSVDIGTYNKLLGKSYGEMASDSRTMHKSQGFGVARNRGIQYDYLKLLDGDSFVEDEFSGINTTWNRLPGASEINTLISELISNFRYQNPSANIPGLLTVRKLIQKNISNSYWRELKTIEIERLILACSGLFLEATSETFAAVPGDSLPISASLINRSDFPVTLLNVQCTGFAKDTLLQLPLPNNNLQSIPRTLSIPPDQKYTTPYWLEKPHSLGLFSTSYPWNIGIPETEAPIQIKFTLKINEDTLFISRPLVYKWVDPVRGELYRAFEILPTVSIQPANGVYLFTKEGAQEINITLKGISSNVKGNVQLDVPKGWKVSPPNLPFELTEKNEEKKFSFNVTPPKEFGEGTLHANVLINGKKTGKNIVRVEYEHIPIQTLVKEAEARIVHMNLNTVPLKVAYIEGAGDNIPSCLHQIGYDVTLLDDENLSRGDLSSYDVIITGIRLYNTNDRMNVYQPRLMDYAKAGGTLLVQYNTSNFLSSLKSEIGPYPFKITRDRVTDETAEVLFIKPDHQLLQQPNRIEASDFKGWIQERGLYFAGDYGTEYETLLSMHDPGEKALEGSLIYAKYGKGQFIYTGISFFRELPAGVAGAYRLFVNLMAAGKPQHD